MEYFFHVFANWKKLIPISMFKAQRNETKNSLSFSVCYIMNAPLENDLIKIKVASSYK